MPRLTRFRILLFLLWLGSLCAPLKAADTAITALVESSTAIGTSSVPRPDLPAAVTEPWLQWARMGANASVVSPRVVPQDAAQAQAVRSAREASVLIVSPADDTGVQAKAAAQLEAGLYRVAAAVIDPAMEAGSPPAVRAWRMESVLLAKPGISAKKVRLRPGQILIVRWTETIAEAREALQAARRSEAAQGGPTTYTGVTIGKALGQSARLLGEIQALVTRGKRPEAIRRTHLALLYVAQAQAMARNRPGASSGDADDAAFAMLTKALSEVSAAASNLVPSESVIAGKEGTPAEIKVSLTNAGSKPVPSATLALSAASPADVTGTRRVFRSIAPGATVSARFPAPPSLPGTGATVQFIQGVGAALVTAAPPP